MNPFYDIHKKQSDPKRQDPEYFEKAAEALPLGFFCFHSFCSHFFFIELCSLFLTWSVALAIKIRCQTSQFTTQPFSPPFDFC